MLEQSICDDARPAPADTAAPPRAAAAPRRLPRLLIMLPALNEAATIQSVIRSIPRSIEGVASAEILVIDDGSTDDTAALARAVGASVISHGLNLGVGAALQSGLDEALRRRVDIAVNIDSDGQFDPAHIPILVRPILAGETDFVSASRFLHPALIPEMPLTKKLGNRGMSWLISKLAGRRFADVSCGFRAYSREAMLQLVLTGKFTYTQETFLVLAQKGLRLYEIPLAVRGVREHGTSRVASNLFRYAFRTSSIIWSCIRDYRPGSIFNSVSFVLLLISLGLGGFFIWHRITAGLFTPHIWAGFVSAFFFGLALMLFALGQIALMVARLRMVQDKQLYLMRRYLQRNEDS